MMKRRWCISVRRPGVPQLAGKSECYFQKRIICRKRGQVNLASEELVYQSNSHASKEYRMEMVKAMVQRLAKEVAQ